jgi:hypothetical protein
MSEEKKDLNKKEKIIVEISKDKLPLIILCVHGYITDKYEGKFEIKGPYCKDTEQIGCQSIIDFQPDLWAWSTDEEQLRIASEDNIKRRNKKIKISDGELNLLNRVIKRRELLTLGEELRFYYEKCRYTYIIEDQKNNSYYGIFPSKYAAYAFAFRHPETFTEKVFNKMKVYEIYGNGSLTHF